MYKDLDGDGKLSVLGDGKEGSGDVKYLGDKNPRYNFGFNLSMAWKGFDLSAFIQGVGRRTMFLEGRAGARCQRHGINPPSIGMEKLGPRKERMPSIRRSR